MRMAMGSGAGEEGLKGEEAERLWVASSSAWSSQQSGGLPGSPGRRGALELGVAPTSLNKGRRESERLSGRLWRHSSVAWDKRSFGIVGNGRWPIAWCAGRASPLNSNDEVGNQERMSRRFRWAV
jgi:hypothetical protein